MPRAAITGAPAQCQVLLLDSIVTCGDKAYEREHARETPGEASMITKGIKELCAEAERHIETMTVEQVMESGPATIRADANVDHTRERLRQHRVHDVLVTTPEGQLLGVLAMTTDSITT